MIRANEECKYSLRSLAERYITFGWAYMYDENPQTVFYWLCVRRTHTHTFALWCFNHSSGMFFNSMTVWMGNFVSFFPSSSFFDLSKRFNVHITLFFWIECVCLHVDACEAVSVDFVLCRSQPTYLPTYLPPFHLRSCIFPNRLVCTKF